MFPHVSAPTETGCLLAVAVALAVALLLGVAAPAGAEDEPENDTLPGAEGPLRTGTHTGTIRSGQDEADWYYFYVQPQVELTIEASSEDCGEYNNLESNLYGRNGYNYNEEGYLQSGTYDPIAYTTPPGLPQLYYFVVKCDDPESTDSKDYSFEIGTSPSRSLISGPVPFGPPVGVSEPNEFREQAIGPLAGGITYQGVTGTDNDEDWFYFYTKSQQPLEISATSFDPSCSELRRQGGELEFYPDENDTFTTKSADIDVHGVDRIGYTSEPGFTKHYISAGCRRSSYAFRIDPPSAIASAYCIAALSGREAAAGAARKVKRKLRRVKRRHRVLMRKLKRRVKHKRRAGAAKRKMRRAKRRHRKRIRRLKPRAANSTAILRQSEATANAACA